MDVLTAAKIVRQVIPSEKTYDNGKVDEKQDVELESPPSGRDCKQYQMIVDSGDGDELDGEYDSLTNENSVRKHRRRRGKSKKRKWKPYFKLTLQERRELEETEGERADKVRAERFAHGQPVAPYNTTQFLMEDHDVKEPDLNRMHNVQKPSTDKTSEVKSVSHNPPVRLSPSTPTKVDEDFYYSSPDDEGDFLQKEFSEDYKNAHAERLNSLSKGELVQEYLQLEDRVEKLERELKELRSRVNENSRCPSRSSVLLSSLVDGHSQSPKVNSVFTEPENRELIIINTNRHFKEIELSVNKSFDAVS